jgi:hypothetical protein
LAGAFFAAAFLAAGFFAAFFAVAITFLLDQVEETLRLIGTKPTPCSDSPPKVCPGGAPRCGEWGCEPRAPLLSATLRDPRILISAMTCCVSLPRQGAVIPRTTRHPTGSR